MLVVAAVVLVGVGLLLALPAPSADASAWSRDRGSIGTFLEGQTDLGNLTESRITYPSLGGTARAVLWLPNRTNATSLTPAVVHMTGRTVDAEGARNLARFLGSLGVATLSVEKRGGDAEITPEKTRTWIWDLLRGFDHLRAPLPGTLRAALDPEAIAVSGDSIGANAALVAAGAEPRFKGVLAFSGFPDSRLGPDLDPSAAVARISGRPVAFFHAREDSIVPLEQGRALFDRAREPKFFYVLNGTCHGYCPDMFPQVEEQVLRMFSPVKSPNGSVANSS
jgi:fermentation-respiration switch protein FrsA (DUF1100 family)